MSYIPWRERLRIIPLARHGFIAVDPETNPIGYYFEVIATGRVLGLGGDGFPTFEDAAKHADAMGIMELKRRARR